MLTTSGARLLEFCMPVPVSSMANAGIYMTGYWLVAHGERVMTVITYMQVYLSFIQSNCVSTKISSLRNAASVPLHRDTCSPEGYIILYQSYIGAYDGRLVRYGIAPLKRTIKSSISCLMDCGSRYRRTIALHHHLKCSLMLLPAYCLTPKSAIY